MLQKQIWVPFHPILAKKMVFILSFGVVSVVTKYNKLCLISIKQTYSLIPDAKFLSLNLI